MRLARAVKQRAEQTAVEIAGTEERVTERKRQVEVPRLHESQNVMRHMHPPHRVHQRNVLEIGVPLVIEVRKRVEPLVHQIIERHRQDDDVARISREQPGERPARAVSLRE